MEKIQENMCFDVVLYENITCLFTHFLLYFLHLVLTFTPPPHYIIMVKGLLVKEDTAVGSYEKFDEKNLTV